MSDFARDHGRPPVTDPRATSGDDRHEPDWEEGLTITVGHQNAQIVGSDDRAIQAAVDYCKNVGGGTVRLLPGVYHMKNSVHLRTGTRIVGSGPDSVLMKGPSAKTSLSTDSDWYDQEITLEDAGGFGVGDGVCLRTRNPHHGGVVVLNRTLVARRGNRFKLDRPLREDFWVKGESIAETLFPLIRGEGVTDVQIEDVALDGNREHNGWLDGNYSGCIWLQDCSRVRISGVIARNANGDGISWQICHDVFVEHCHVHDNKDLGLHPGSGSQRPLIRNNLIERNGIGLFFCWGVKYGLAEKNRIVGCRRGISIGHRDNDNLIRDNDVLQSTHVGVLFRPERGPEYAPHRNRLEGNRILDTGGEDGIGVDLQGGVGQVVIANNDIRETRGPAGRIGVKIGEQTGEIHLQDNRIEGFAQPVLDLRKS